MFTLKRTAAAAAALASLIGLASAQSQPAYQTRNLTPDGYWHNRYHGILAMAAYGPYNDTCPVQTFTEAAKLRNFPDSNRTAWTVLETWDTPSGCTGFSAIVPEMNKVLLVFRGNPQMEANLDMEIVSWDEIGSGIGSTCDGCTVNAYALQGYNEAKNATNNWETTRAAYAGAGLVFSITGHGLGGMHSLIASVDYNYQRIAYYSHNFGTPRTFNAPGVAWYNARFNGEAGERGLFNNDMYTEYIPASEDYMHAGTTFYYWGMNNTIGAPNWNICWPDDEGYLEDPACLPHDEPNTGTPEQDRYFYWTNVGDCGRPNTFDTQKINAFLEFAADPANEDGVFSYGPVQQPSTSSSTGGRRPTSTSSQYYAPATRTTRATVTLYSTSTSTRSTSSTSSRRSTSSSSSSSD